MIPASRQRRPGEEEHEHAAQVATPVAPSIASITALQQGAGNAAVSRLLAPPAVARFKREASGAVGGHRADADVLDDPLAKGKKLEVGQHGYIREALAQLPKMAGKKLASYADQQLAPVSISFDQLDKQIAESAKTQRQLEDDKGGTPSAVKTYERRIEMWQRSGEVLAEHRGREEKWVQDFNAGVPRANHMLVSLARLDGLQTMLGVTDPQKMAESVVYSLDKAKPIAQQAQRAKKEMSVPAADASVTQAAKDLTSAQGKMQAAWGHVHVQMTMDYSAEIAKRGDDDRKELERINKNIEGFKKAGAFIDAGMGAMGKVAPASTKPTKSQLSDMDADIRDPDADAPSVKDKSYKDMPGEAAKVGASLGLEIPTSVGGLLEMGAKIYYGRELERIRQHLRELEIHAGAYAKAAKKEEIANVVNDFKVAVEAYETAATALQNTLVARQAAYMDMGEDLDKLSPGGGTHGQERFATVMTVVAAVREVLAMATGAEKGLNMHSLQVGQQVLAMSDEREMYAYTLEEDKAMGKLIAQLKKFEGNTETLREILGPIEAKAGEFMRELTPGKVGGEY